MNGPGSQALGKATERNLFATEYDFANGGVVRQHADDDLTVEEVSDIRCGLEAKRRELGLLLRTTDIGDNHVRWRQDLPPSPCPSDQGRQNRRENWSALLTLVASLSRARATSVASLRHQQRCIPLRGKIACRSRGKIKLPFIKLNSNL